MYNNWNGVVSECYDLYQALDNDGLTSSPGACYQFYIDLGAVRNNWGGGSSTIGGRILEMFDHVNENMGGGEVDMSAILTAMLAATPDEIEQFVGIVDAFKVSIWNRPYNEEFYAALARGFAQW